MSWKTGFPQYKQQLDAYRLELVNAIRDCRFAKINGEDGTYGEAVDALFLILPPEIKTLVEKEVRDIVDVIPKETIDRIREMKVVDAHFAARRAEERYSRSEVDRMFSITVDHLSKAGLLLSSAPKGVGRVGKPAGPKKE
jgi:hypothetical protein